MTYNMLRRTKSSSLLPLVRYFYGDSPEDSSKDMFPNDTTSQQSTCTTRSISISSAVDVWNSRITASGNAPSGSLTPPPDYEQLYQAMQLENHDDRVRKKYACQGLKLVASSLAEDSDALSGREVGFSRDLYIHGVEYILRGLPGIFLHLHLIRTLTLLVFPVPVSDVS